MSTDREAQLTLVPRCVQLGNLDPGLLLWAPGLLWPSGIRRHTRCGIEAIVAGGLARLSRRGEDLLHDVELDDGECLVVRSN